MTDEMMSLRTLLEKSTDADFLREMIGFAAQRLMELDVESLTGAVGASCPPFASASLSRNLHSRLFTFDTFNSNRNMQTLTFGSNYKFGWDNPAYPPVAARY